MFQAQPIRSIVLAMAERRYLRPEGFANALSEAYGRAPTRDELDAYLVPLLQPNTLPAILDGYARDMGPDQTPAERLRRSPSLIMWGAEDRWLKRRVAEDFAAALPNAQLVLVEGAAHSPMETHAGAVSDALVSRFAADLIATEVAATAVP
jgi:pimeloyl-ACP methyl ester carboxylesterase